MFCHYCLHKIMLLNNSLLLYYFLWIRQFKTPCLDKHLAPRQTKECFSSLWLEFNRVLDQGMIGLAAKSNLQKHPYYTFYIKNKMKLAFILLYCSWCCAVWWP